MSIIERTMQGIISALASGGWVSHRTIAPAVISAGGRVDRIGEATKRLRDMGFPIVINKRRHLTAWRMDPNDPEQLAQHDRIVSEAYSEILSYWRALTGAQQTTPTMATFSALRDVNAAVGALGLAMGKTYAEIGADQAVAVNTTGRTP